jgi:tetratricopeptide (TPR) repeat protein
MLLLAILTAWLPGRAAVVPLQAGIFLLALAWAGRAVWRPRRPQTSFLLIPLAGAVLWGLLQLLMGWTVYRLQTWETVLAWGSYLAVFWLALEGFGTGELRSWFRRTLIVFGLVLTVVSVVQHFTAPGRVFWLFPFEYSNVGPFRNRNNFATFVQLVLPLALYEALRDRRKALSHALIAAAMYASVIGVASRAGSILVTLEVLAMAFFALSPRFRAAGTARRALSWTGLLALAFAAVVGWDVLWNRFQAPDQFGGRRELIQASLPMAGERPWTGSGLGTWATVYPEYAVTDFGLDMFVNYAHSDWAEWAAEGGLPFLALLLAVALWSVRLAIRFPWGLGVVSVFCHSVVDFPMQRPALAAPAIALLGVMAAAARHTAGPDRLARPPGGAMNRALLRTAAVAGVAVAGVALYWSLRIAYAGVLFGRNTLSSVERAIRLTPGDASYYVRQAELLQQAGADDQQIEAALARAVDLNPRNSDAWIELGLRAEAQGRFPEAEAHLLKAAHADATHVPRSTLANYYFRRGESGHFWRWVREAIGTAPGDMAPLFRLCWSMSGDAALILERAIPNRPEALWPYVFFLLRTPNPEAAEAAAEPMLRNPAHKDRLLYLAYCDRLLEIRETARAARVWRLMVAQGMIEHRAPAPDGGGLTNGDFQIEPRGRGFDWRIPVVEGVAASRDPRPPTLRLSFSGSQPGQCEVLWQYLPPLAAGRYRLDFEYRTADVAPDTGLRWEIIGLADAPPARLAESASLSAEDWTRGGLEFTAPGRLPGARLVLAYRRAPGTTRITGWIALRGLRLQPSGRP